MRRQCTIEDTLWTRPFAAKYIGVSVSSLQKLMFNGALPYCYPFPDNELDVRLFREDVIAYRERMREDSLRLQRKAASHFTSRSQLFQRRNYHD